MFEKIEQLNLDQKVVVLPDFFLDRIIKLNSKDEFFRMINSKTTIGEGSIRGVDTFDIKAGDAVNFTYCLAKFGLNLNHFTIAVDFGKSVLNSIFSKFGKSVELEI